MSTSPPQPVSGEVALFSEIRQRPGLLLREIAWRWICGGLLLLLAAYEVFRIWAASLPALRNTGILEVTADNLLEDPPQLLASVTAALGILWPPVERAALGLAPLMIFCWIGAFVLGRGAILARYDGRLLHRPFLLAACEGLRLCLLFGVPALGATFLQLALHFASRGGSANLLLSIPLVLGGVVALFILGTRLTRTLTLTMTIGLLEPLSFAEAFGQAWRLYHGAMAPQARSLRKAARRAQFALFIILVVCTFFPSPFSGGWLLLFWWVVLSLLPLAAQDAARLGIMFTLLDVVRVVRPVVRNASPARMRL